MKEIFTMTILIGLFFLSFVVTLIIGITRKKKELKWASLMLFLIFCGITAWTGVKFVSKSYNKVSEIFKPRTGDEIYDALFDKRQADCVKILNYQDQVIPKIDYAIWLHFEMCPTELKRILNRYEFTGDKLPTDKFDRKIPDGETLEWFNPTTLGDSIMVYEYSTKEVKIFRLFGLIWIVLKFLLETSSTKDANKNNKPEPLNQSRDKRIDDQILL